MSYLLGSFSYYICQISKIIPDCSATATSTRKPEDQPGAIAEHNPDALLGGYTAVNGVGVTEIKQGWSHPYFLISEAH